MFTTLRVNDNPFLTVERGPRSAIEGRSPHHLACKHCREKKIKCSGEKEGCESCRDKALVCEYRKKPRQTQPKPTAETLESSSKPQDAAHKASNTESFDSGLLTPPGAAPASGPRSQDPDNGPAPTNSPASVGMKPSTEIDASFDEFAASTNEFGMASFSSDLGLTDGTCVPDASPNFDFQLPLESGPQSLKTPQSIMALQTQTDQTMDTAMSDLPYLNDLENDFLTDPFPIGAHLVPSGIEQPLTNLAEVQGAHPTSGSASMSNLIPNETCPEYGDVLKILESLEIEQVCASNYDTDQILAPVKQALHKFNTTHRGQYCASHERCNMLWAMVTRRMMSLLQLQQNVCERGVGLQPDELNSKMNCINFWKTTDLGFYTVDTPGEQWLLSIELIKLLLQSVKKLVDDLMNMAVQHQWKRNLKFLSKLNQNLDT